MSRPMATMAWRTPSLSSISMVYRVVWIGLASCSTTLRRNWHDSPVNPSCTANSFRMKLVSEPGVYHDHPVCCTNFVGA